jgi:hypothetical protein
LISWFKKIFGIKPKLFRHGDLLIRKVSSIPKTAILTSTNIIAEGEKIGHNHELKGSQQVFETLDKQLYFEAKQDVILKHPDHNTLDIPKGRYIVEHQRRYDPFEDTQEEVMD